MKRIVLALVAIALLSAVVVQARSGRNGAREHAAERIQKSPAGDAPDGIRTAGDPTRNNVTERIMAEGRLVAYPGAEVVVGTDRLGRIVRLAVEEKSAVRKGDIIAELDADDVRASLNEARARVAAAQAEVDLGEVEIQRAEALLQRELGTQQAVDRARRDRDAARARLAAEQASVLRLTAVVAKSRIVAPLDGVVLERYVDSGETVREGDRVVKIADLDRVRVEAEVDEFDSGRIKLGAVVLVTAEGYDGQSWAGHVEEVPDAVVERGLQPRDPGQPTDTRVLRVKIGLEQATPLKLGQRVQVRIATAVESAALRPVPAKVSS
jgi:HlyD family secretion protein